MNRFHPLFSLVFILFIIMSCYLIREIDTAVFAYRFLNFKQGVTDVD